MGTHGCCVPPGGVPSSAQQVLSHQVSALITSSIPTWEHPTSLVPFGNVGEKTSIGHCRAEAEHFQDTFARRFSLTGRCFPMETVPWCSNTSEQGFLDLCSSLIIGLPYNTGTNRPRTELQRPKPHPTNTLTMGCFGGFLFASSCCCCTLFLQRQTEAATRKAANLLKPLPQWLWSNMSPWKTIISSQILGEYSAEPL